jgi:cobalt-zinc-cadmium efflux system membrane fusion protein
MSIKYSIKILALSLLFIGATAPHVSAHGGDEVAVASPPHSYFSSEATSDKYELLLRYETIEPGEKTTLVLFVSDFATNRPVSGAVLKITAREDSKLSFTARQTAEGTYAVQAIFPEKKKYSLVVNVNSTLGADLLLLSGIEVDKELPHTEHAQEENVFSNWQVWALVALALLAGLGLGILFQKRNSPKGKAAVALLLLFLNFLLPVHNAAAHGDDDHGAKNTAAGFSNSFDVPKETQFLFDVLTQRVQPGSFTESTKLFGTIVPSSAGQAAVTTPQNGKITSLNVNVGQQVHAGQQLAVIEQNIDAGTQVNMLAEKNSLTAEYQAAKKDVDRLSVVRDIAAKKDLDEAAARLQKAAANLELFTGKSGRAIVLNAPIAGVVSNFNLSIGSTVNAGQTLFSVTNLSYVYAEAQVFDKDAAKVQQGARFTIECSNDNHKSSEVQLLSLAQEINATNQSQRVLFKLANPDSDFKIGEFVNIRVFASQKTQQIALPNSAITEINGKPVVFIKDAAEKYSISYVQTGNNNGSYTTILKGVEEGERVVVSGSYQLKMIYLNQ